MHMVGKTRSDKEFSNLFVKVDFVCGSLEERCSFCTIYGICITFLLTVRVICDG